LIAFVTIKIGKAKKGSPFGLGQAVEWDVLAGRCTFELASTAEVLQPLDPVSTDTEAGFPFALFGAR
jgi:hypothetical protein